MFNQDYAETPQFSIEYEEGLLGKLLVSNSAIIEVIDKVCPDDFYSGDHKVIFRAMVEFHNSQFPFDIVTLSNHFDSVRQRNSFNVSWMYYLGNIANNSTGSQNADAYAVVVKNFSLKRQFIKSCKESIEKAMLTHARDFAPVMDAHQNEIFKLFDQMQAKHHGAVVLKEVLFKTIDDIETRIGLPEGAEVPIPFGISGFDEKSDFDPGLIVIAGRPGHGKTAFIVSGLCHAHSVKSGFVSAIFEMEMTDIQIGKRILANRGNIDSALLLKPKKMDDNDHKRLTNGANLAQDFKMYIDDRWGQNFHAIRRECLKIRFKEGRLDAIVLDHLGLVDIDDNNKLRAAAIGDFTRRLTELAKEFNCPVILLCQLNRKIEERDDKRPMMSDLRDSGRIEEDAKAIYFLYRDDVYKDDKTPLDHTLEIICAKSRFTSAFTERAREKLPYCKFTDFDNPLYSPSDYE